MTERQGKPVRLQLRRTKGFNLQEVSRATNGLAAVNCARPGRYGNPWVVNENTSALEATAMHMVALKDLGGLHRKGAWLSVAEIRTKLAGKNLACFCPLDSEWCHVDTLLEVANGD